MFSAKEITAMQVICISHYGGVGRTEEVHIVLFSFPDSAWQSKENAWNLQLLAVNQNLSNIYGILMLGRKQSGYFFLLF